MDGLKGECVERGGCDNSGVLPVPRPPARATSGSGAPFQVALGGGKLLGLRGWIGSVGFATVAMGWGAVSINDISVADRL